MPPVGPAERVGPEPPGRAWKAHLASIAPRLEAIQQEIERLDARDWRRRAALMEMRDILKSGTFDARYYLATYADVREAGIDPLEHYVSFGAAEGRKPNAVFNPPFYDGQRGHKRGVPANPLLHYIRKGEAAGLSPTPDFDPKAYLAAHSAAAAAGVSPLWDHLRNARAANGHAGRNGAGVAASKPALRQWLRPRGRPGVNFIGPVEMVSGLGTSARGYLAALSEAAVPVHIVPWTVGFERQQRVAVKLPAIPVQPINIVHLNADMSHLWVPKLASLMGPNRYNVAIWYWELSSFRPEWMGVTALFDEIWCASRFAERSIGAVSPRPVRTVRPAVPPLNAPAATRRQEFGLNESAYTFFYICDIGSKLDRKNPLALAAAYTAEFRPDEGAALLLKTNYVDHDCPQYRRLRELTDGRPDILVMEDILSAERLAGLWSLIDCYVSPHRSEGLGLTVIEAMQMGKPVIGTPYGGVADFLNPENALCLDYRLAEIEETVEPYPAGFVWADPQIASIRARMRWAFDNRSAARAIGNAGRQSVSDMFSLGRTSADLKGHIERIWASGSA